MLECYLKSLIFLLIYYGSLLAAAALRRTQPSTCKYTKIMLTANSTRQQINTGQDIYSLLKSGSQQNIHHTELNLHSKSVDQFLCDEFITLQNLSKNKNLFISKPDKRKQLTFLTHYLNYQMSPREFQHEIYPISHISPTNHKI